MCLGEGDGAVDVDVDLLAAGHLDVLVRISEEYKENIKKGPRRRGLKSGATYQVEETICKDEDGLCSCGAATNIRGAVGGRGSANAQDQTVGFDVGLEGVGRFKLHRKPENSVTARRGRSQFAVLATVQRDVVSGEVGAGISERGRCVRVSVLEVAVLAARLRWHSVQDGAKLVAWVARILRFRRC